MRGIAFENRRLYLQKKMFFPWKNHYWKKAFLKRKMKNYI